MVVSGDLKKRQLICDFAIEGVDVQKDINNEAVRERFINSGLYEDLQNPAKTTSLQEAE